jgi:hypothetical protein
LRKELRPDEAGETLYLAVRSLEYVIVELTESPPTINDTLIGRSRDRIDNIL